MNIKFNNINIDGDYDTVQVYDLNEVKEVILDTFFQDREDDVDIIINIDEDDRYFEAQDLLSGSTIYGNF